MTKSFFMVGLALVGLVYSHPAACRSAAGNETLSAAGNETAHAAGEHQLLNGTHVHHHNSSDAEAFRLQNGTHIHHHNSSDAETLALHNGTHALHHNCSDDASSTVLKNHTNEKHPYAESERSHSRIHHHSTASVDLLTAVSVPASSAFAEATQAPIDPSQSAAAFPDQETFAPAPVAPTPAPAAVTPAADPTPAPAAATSAPATPDPAPVVAAPAAPVAAADSGSLTAAQLQIAMPGAGACSGAPTGCLGAAQAAPLLSASWAKYGLTGKAGQAATLALISVESGDLKYDVHLSGNTGQGTFNQMSPTFVVEYAKALYGANAPSDPVAALGMINASPGDSIASAAWYLSAHCASTITQFNSASGSTADAAYSTYITSCVGTTMTGDRQQAWTRAKQALGV